MNTFLRSSPALLEHCQTVYSRMSAEALLVTMSDDSQQETEVLVYQGFLTKLFVDVQLSIPYYTAVTSALISMDCIKQLRRGGGASPSQWALLREPNLELFIDKKDKAKASEPVLQMVRDLNERLSHCENTLKWLQESLKTEREG
jgi:hypothetical protein